MSASETPRISVIVPHYNDEDRLQKCLEALHAQSGLDGPIEIVVGDNDSAVGFAEMQRRFGEMARIVHVPERGAGPARNAAVAASRGDILAFIDSDCLPSKDWIAQGVRALATSDIVGGRVDVSIEHDDALSGAEAFEKIFAFDNRSYILRKGFSGSGNLFCRRTVFEHVGGFQGEVSEDRDWCNRAVRAGYSLAYAHDAAIEHPARPDWATLQKKWRRLNSEAYALAKQEGWSNWKWLGYAWLMPASIVPHLVKCAGSGKVRGFRDRTKAAATLVRLRLWRLWDYHRIVLRAGD